MVDSPNDRAEIGPVAELPHRLTTLAHTEVIFGRLTWTIPAVDSGREGQWPTHKRVSGTWTETNHQCLRDADQARWLAHATRSRSMRCANAAGSFVDLNAFQERVGMRIAELTHNEAAYVSSGAAAGIMLSVASCIAGSDAANTFAFPQLDRHSKNEVIVQKVQRNGYDYAIAQTGATVVEIGNTAAELEAAITDRTACIVWFAGGPLAKDALPIEDVIRIAKQRGVPVIVDAAAQIPPVSSLWHFTRDLGATGAIFSGGKGIRGPQSSGLVLGTKELIAGCRANGNPNHSIGRPMKVGKEEMAGLLAAVEYTLEQDETALLEQYENIVHGWIEDLAGLPGVTAERRFPSEAGQPHGRTFIHFNAPCPVSRDEVVTHSGKGTRASRSARSRTNQTRSPSTRKPSSPTRQTSSQVASATW